MPIELTLPDGLRSARMVDPDGNADYRLVFSSGRSDYESYIEGIGGPDTNARLLRAMLGGRGTLIDLGANIGTIAVPLARSGSAVVAVEMNPSNCLKLWLAARLNGLKNLTVVQAAVGDSHGMVTFEGDEAWGTVSRSDKGTPSVYITLDTVLAAHPDLAAPVVLKIDIEGHEAAALRGATAFLARHRPAVLFECIEIEGVPNYAARTSKQLLEGLGYRLYLQRGDVFCPKSSLDIQEGHVADFLALPQESTFDLTHIGRVARFFTPEERLAWVQEMAAFPMVNHQRHAAGVLLRWHREGDSLARQAAEVLRPMLLNCSHLADLHPALSAIA